MLPLYHRYKKLIKGNPLKLQIANVLFTFILSTHHLWNNVNYCD